MAFRFSLIPREEPFFELYRSTTDQIRGAARELEAMLAADPLMGWAGSGDTQQQVQLKFPDKEAALAYAAKYGIAAEVHAVPPRRLKLQSYADNFR